MALAVPHPRRNVPSKTQPADHTPAPLPAARGTMPNHLLAHLEALALLAARTLYLDLRGDLPANVRHSIANVARLSSSNVASAASASSTDGAG